MKKVLSLVIGLFLFSAVNAQWSTGIRLGLGTSAVSPEEVLISMKTDEINYRLNYLGNTRTYSAGLFAETGTDYAFIEFGLNYSHSSAYYDLEGFGDYRANTNTYFEQYSNLEIPILAGGKYKIFRLGAGPIVSYNLNTTSELPTVDGFNSDQEKIILGSQAAFGVTIGILSVDLRYIRTFAELGDHFTFGNNHKNGFKQSPRDLKITVGISF